MTVYSWVRIQTQVIQLGGECANLQVILAAVLTQQYGSFSRDHDSTLAITQDRPVSAGYKTRALLGSVVVL